MEPIVGWIEDFVRDDPGNRIPGTEKPLFDAPLIAVASADDPKFDELKRPEVVGERHRSPREWLSDARSVIVYFLPITQEIVASNGTGDRASDEWMYARFYGEMINERLRRSVEARLRDAGYSALAPGVAPEQKVVDMNSNWSERHVAYVAGLGTFGLHAGFISERGVSGRIGSVVTSLQLDPTRFAEVGSHGNCLHYRGVVCGQCLTRCPAGALHLEGKDRSRCNHHLKEVWGPEVRQNHGFPYSPCGKCYVNVPCASVNPTVGL